MSQAQHLAAKRRMQVQRNGTHLLKALKPFMEFYAIYRTMPSLCQETIYECCTKAGTGRLTGEMFLAAEEAIRKAESL